jgi:hypothetical protein
MHRIGDVGIGKGSDTGGWDVKEKGGGNEANKKGGGGGKRKEAGIWVVGIGDPRFLTPAACSLLLAA